MNTTVATQETGPSVIQDMATRFGMDKRAFESTIRATCMPGNVQVSNEQFAAFLLVAKQYDLNPLTKEIYAFPAKSGGIQPIVGIDGWCNIINSHPQLDGITFEDKMLEGKLTAITCRINRKDREHPIECTEYLSECARDTQPWKQWPIRMLRHKALIQCARYAFGFSGIVEQDEAERQEMIDVTPQDGNQNFMRNLRHELQDHINAPTKEMAKEAAAQVASGASLTKTPFKTHTARGEYRKNVMAALEKATSPEEIASILGSYSEIDTMSTSENEHDRFAARDILAHYSLLRTRLLIATRETPEEDTGTFDEEEVPAFLRDKKAMDAEFNSKVG